MPPPCKTFFQEQKIPKTFFQGTMMPNFPGLQLLSSLTKLFKHRKLLCASSFF